MNRVFISIMCNAFTGMCSIYMISLFLPIQVLVVSFCDDTLHLRDIVLTTEFYILC